MKTTVQLVDQQQRVVATAAVADDGVVFGGTINSASLPTSVRQLFEEYEEIVNGQMFSFLDEIERRIASLRLHAVFADGTEVALNDLQVYPTLGTISFKVADVIAKPIAS